jgi:hypothetical protein
MDKLNTLLGPIRTRGEFRALNERAEQGRSRMSVSELSPESPIWDAWESLKAAYPGSTAGWDSEPPTVWCALLGDLTGEQLLNGLRNLVRHVDSRGQTSAFPPSAPQFRDLCLTNYAWETAAQRNDFTGCAQIEDLTGREKRIAERKAQLKQLREQSGL